jgi:hypothetical protein
MSQNIFEIFNILISDVRYKTFKAAVDRKCKLDRKKRGHKGEYESNTYVLVSEGTLAVGLSKHNALKMYWGVEQ